MLRFFIVLAVLVISIQTTLFAGIFSSKEGKTFVTRGVGEIVTTGTFNFSTEEKNIPIPSYIDVSNSQRWNGLTHDAESGWSYCRVPLRGKLSWTGPQERSFIFQCKPITYFN